MRFRRHPPPPQPQSPAEGSQWTVAGEASPSALSSTAAPPPPSSQEKLIFGGEPVENEGDRWLSRLQDATDSEGAWSPQPSTGGQQRQSVKLLAPTDIFADEARAAEGAETTDQSARPSPRVARRKHSLRLRSKKPPSEDQTFDKSSPLPSSHAGMKGKHVAERATSSRPCTRVQPRKLAAISMGFFEKTDVRFAVNAANPLPAETQPSSALISQTLGAGKEDESSKDAAPPPSVQPDRSGRHSLLSRIFKGSKSQKKRVSAEILQSPEEGELSPALRGSEALNAEVVPREEPRVSAEIGAKELKVESASPFSQPLLHDTSASEAAAHAPDSVQRPREAETGGTIFCEEKKEEAPESKAAAALNPSGDAQSLSAARPLAEEFAGKVKGAGRSVSDDAAADPSGTSSPKSSEKAGRRSRSNNPRHRAAKAEASLQSSGPRRSVTTRSSVAVRAAPLLQLPRRQTTSTPRRKLDGLARPSLRKHSKPPENSKEGEAKSPALCEEETKEDARLGAPAVPNPKTEANAQIDSRAVPQPSPAPKASVDRREKKTLLLPRLSVRSSSVRASSRRAVSEEASTPGDARGLSLRKRKSAHLQSSPSAPQEAQERAEAEPSPAASPPFAKELEEATAEKQSQTSPQSPSLLRRQSLLERQTWLIQRQREEAQRRRMQKIQDKQKSPPRCAAKTRLPGGGSPQGLLRQTLSDSRVTVRPPLTLWAASPTERQPRKTREPPASARQVPQASPSPLLRGKRIASSSDVAAAASNEASCAAVLSFPVLPPRRTRLASPERAVQKNMESARGVRPSTATVGRRRASQENSLLRNLPPPPTAAASASCESPAARPQNSQKLLASQEAFPPAQTQGAASASRGPPQRKGSCCDLTASLPSTQMEERLPSRDQEEAKAEASSANVASFVESPEATSLLQKSASQTTQGKAHPRSAPQDGAEDASPCGLLDRLKSQERKHEGQGPRPEWGAGAAAGEGFEGMEREERPLSPAATATALAEAFDRAAQRAAEMIAVASFKAATNASQRQKMAAAAALASSMGDRHALSRTETESEEKQNLFGGAQWSGSPLSKNTFVSASFSPLDERGEDVGPAMKRVILRRQTNAEHRRGPSPVLFGGSLKAPPSAALCGGVECIAAAAPLKQRKASAKGLRRWPSVEVQQLVSGGRLLLVKARKDLKAMRLSLRLRDSQLLCPEPCVPTRLARASTAAAQSPSAGAVNGGWAGGWPFANGPSSSAPLGAAGGVAHFPSSAASHQQRAEADGHGGTLAAAAAAGSSVDFPTPVFQVEVASGVVRTLRVGEEESLSEALHKLCVEERIPPEGERELQLAMKAERRKLEVERQQRQGLVPQQMAREAGEEARQVSAAQENVLSSAPTPQSQRGPSLYFESEAASDEVSRVPPLSPSFFEEDEEVQLRTGGSCGGVWAGANASSSLRPPLAETESLTPHLAASATQCQQPPRHTPSASRESSPVFRSPPTPHPAAALKWSSSRLQAESSLCSSLASAAQEPATGASSAEWRSCVSRLPSQSPSPKRRHEAEAAAGFAPEAALYHSGFDADCLRGSRPASPFSEVCSSAFFSPAETSCWAESQTALDDDLHWRLPPRTRRRRSSCLADDEGEGEFKFLREKRRSQRSGSVSAQRMERLLHRVSTQRLKRQMENLQRQLSTLKLQHASEQQHMRSYQELQLALQREASEHQLSHLKKLRVEQQNLQARLREQEASVESAVLAMEELQEEVLDAVDQQNSQTEVGGDLTPRSLELQQQRQALLQGHLHEQQRRLHDRLSHLEAQQVAHQEQREDYQRQLMELQMAWQPLMQKITSRQTQRKQHPQAVSVQEALQGGLRRLLGVEKASLAESENYQRQSQEDKVRELEQRARRWNARLQRESQLQALRQRQVEHLLAQEQRERMENLSQVLNAVRSKGPQAAEEAARAPLNLKKNKASAALAAAGALRRSMQQQSPGASPGVWTPRNSLIPRGRSQSSSDSLESLTTDWSSSSSGLSASVQRQSQRVRWGNATVAASTQASQALRQGLLAGI